MFKEVSNPADHSEHDPSTCDYARIWLTQQFVSGKPCHIEKLTTEQLIIVGFRSALYSTHTDITEAYTIFGLTAKNLYDFSEYIRLFLMNERGLNKLLPTKNPNLN